MFGLIAGSFTSKLVIASALALIAKFAIGSMIDELGKGKAYEREIEIRAAITKEDSKLIAAQSSTIEQYKQDLRITQRQVDDFRSKQERKRADLPKTPEDKDKVMVCPEICIYK